MATTLPVSALLSKVLVAYTIEFDNTFEERVRDAGHAGYISHAAWWNVMRFLRDGMTIGEFAAAVPMKPAWARRTLGGLERWEYVVPVPDVDPPKALRMGRMDRKGYGTGNGLEDHWTIRLTPRTEMGLRTWPGLAEEIDQRWKDRFGATAIEELGGALATAVDGFDLDAPWGLPDLTWRWVGSLAAPEPPASRPHRLDPSPARPLGVLLSQLVYSLGTEFNALSDVPIAISANLLRVLDERGLTPPDISGRTGLSPVITRLGMWDKKSGLIEEVPNPTKRGNLVRLTPAGARGQAAYEPLSRSIEQDHNLQPLGPALERLLDHPGLKEALRPPPGVPRGGDYSPDLDVGWPKALRTRVRHQARQTAMFIDDPATNLPHYPVWDADRGWGP